MRTLEQDLKHLIVEALNLEDLSPEDIGDDEPLFGEDGLGLDSIDALELGVALRKAYGIKIDTVTEGIRESFKSIKSLSSFIRAFSC